MLTSFQLEELNVAKHSKKASKKSSEEKEQKKKKGRKIEDDEGVCSIAPSSRASRDEAASKICRSE